MDSSSSDSLDEADSHGEVQDRIVLLGNTFDTGLSRAQVVALLRVKLPFFGIARNVSKRTKIVLCGTDMSARELKRIERLEAKGRKPSQGLALGPQLVDFIHTGKFTSASLPCVLKAQNPHPYTARIMERLEQGSAAAYPASAPQPGALHTLYLRMVHPVSSRLKRARRGSKRRSRHTPTVIDDDEDLGASTDTACSSPKRPTAQQSSPAPHASSKDAGSLAPWTGAHTVPSPDHSVSGEGARPSAKARRKHPEQCSAADALAGTVQPWGGLYSQEDAELAAMLAGAALSDLLG